MPRNKGIHGLGVGRRVDGVSLDQVKEKVESWQRCEIASELPPSFDVSLEISKDKIAPL